MSAVFAVAHMRAPLGVAALVFLINLSLIICLQMEFVSLEFRLIGLLRFSSHFPMVQNPIGRAVGWNKPSKACLCVGRVLLFGRGGPGPWDYTITNQKKMVKNVWY